MGVSIEIQGMDDVMRSIAALRHSVENMGPHLKAGGEKFVESILKNFHAGGRPQRWVAKADGKPSYLKKSGKLSRSIHVVYLSNRMIKIGTNTVYAAIHQFGGEVGPIYPKKAGGVLAFSVGGKMVFARSVRRHSIPARPFMVIPDEDKHIAFMAIIRSMQQEIQAAGNALARANDV